jgi:ribonuclease BN (tRNA processing enzyme)
MKLTVLGCSGSISAGERTTSFLVNDTVLIDCGTGVGDLPTDKLLSIEAVFVTHSHLDHVVCLPMLVDLRNAYGAAALQVTALPQTIAALQAHIFNNLIWPDFTQLPSSQSPALSFRSMEVGAQFEVAGLSVESLPAVHTVPACGYRVQEKASGASFAFTGDSGENPSLWPLLNERDVQALIIDTAFNDDEQALANASLHYHPQQLAKALENYTGKAEIYSTHIKPGEASKVTSQLSQRLAKLQRSISLLQTGQTLYL